MLEVDNLNTYYGESHILRGLNFKVGPGEIAGIIGRNGMGKTTFLKSVVGLLKLREGAIHFEGADITRFRPETRAKRNSRFMKTCSWGWRPTPSARKITKKTCSNSFPS